MPRLRRRRPPSYTGVRWWERDEGDEIPLQIINAAVRPTTFALPITLMYWRRSPIPDRPHP